VQLELDNNFFDEYIEEMIQAEIELEKRIFYDNKSPYEKCYDGIVAELSREMAKEIDNEIMQDLLNRRVFPNENVIITAVQRKCDDDTTLMIDIKVQPVVHYITVDLNLGT